MRLRTYAPPTALLLALAAPTLASAQTAGPELTGRFTAVPRGLAPGASGAVDVEVENSGTGTTGASRQRLWLSADAALDGNDLLLGEATLTPAPGANPQRIPIQIPASAPRGTFSVLLEIDADDAFAEADEADNVIAGGPLATAQDFTAVDVRSDPNQVGLGETVRVQAQPRSLGIPVTGNVAFGVYLSPDGVWDPGDLPVYRGVTFFSGAVDGVPIDVSFPLTGLPGGPRIQPAAYEVLVRIDDADAFAEADETNNAGAASGRLTVIGADLRPLDITTPDVVFMGRTMTITTEIENQGVADANGFTYSYFLSDNDFVGVQDQRIFTSPSIDLPSGQSRVFADTIDVPVLTSTACMWFGVIVNDRNQVAESNINNNARRRFFCVDIVFPIPDLTVQIIDTPTVAAAGEELSVTRLIVNDGTADAAEFTYTWHLSSNPEITAQDPVLGTFRAQVPEGRDDYGIDLLSVPSTLSPGSYFIGVRLDPDDELDEIDETNNTAAVGPVPLFGSAIEIGTNALPSATVGVDYNVGLFVRRAPQPVTWSVSQGSLPNGLTIDGPSGILSGTPTEDGLFEFVLRASAGTAFSEKPFALRVLAPSVDLRIASSALPGAFAGRTYAARLVAVGGQPPYTWEAISDLPQGLTLSADGQLSGTPATPGGLPITVRVRDAIDAAASKELVLQVVSADQTLQIVQIPVPAGRVEAEYCDPQSIRFEARNGTPPLTWSLIGAAPPGLSLSTDGELCGAPERAGTFPVRVRVQDATGQFDTSLFLLEVSTRDQLAITTFTLPGGQEGDQFEATLTAIRGTEPYTWTVLEPGGLPEGVTLDEDGRLFGDLLAAGTFSFVVQVTDAVDRVDVQPLSIEVTSAPPVVEPSDGGCAAGRSAEPLALWAALAAGLLGLRRRRGR